MQRGAFGVHGPGDTSGFGGLVRRPWTAPAAERPYGDWFDDVADVLAEAYPPFGDAVTKVDEVVCLAALVQAICAKLLKLRSQNLGFRKYPPQLIHENKFRAFRFGLDGMLIDFGKQREVAMRELAVELVDFVDDVVDELGSRREVDYVHTILREGTSADRQLAIHEASGGDLRAVVEHLADETLIGLPPPA